MEKKSKVKPQETKTPTEKEAPQLSKESQELSKVDELRAKNMEEERETIQQIEHLTEKLLEVRSMAERKSKISKLEESISELKQAVTGIRSLPLPTPAAVPSPVPNHAAEDCNCGEVKVKKCCMGVYIRRIYVETADDMAGTVLELILALKVGIDQKVVLHPGLTSFISIDKRVGWVTINSPAVAVCVPCGQTTAMPLAIEAMEIDELASVAETGSTTGISLAINCACEFSSDIFEVNLSAGSAIERDGKILVEVAAKKMNKESCCCC